MNVFKNHSFACIFVINDQTILKYLVSFWMGKAIYEAYQMFGKAGYELKNRVST